MLGRPQTHPKNLMRNSVKSLMRKANFLNLSNSHVQLSQVSQNSLKTLKSLEQAWWCHWHSRRWCSCLSTGIVRTIPHGGGMWLKQLHHLRRVPATKLHRYRHLSAQAARRISASHQDSITRIYQRNGIPISTEMLQLTYSELSQLSQLAQLSK